MKTLGDYHLHTRYSDGKATVMDMAQTAKDRGLSEIAITEHGFAHMLGLRRRNFEKMRGEIQSARAIMPVLVGIEANVTSVDGSIDINDDERHEFDIVLLGLHVRVLYGLRTFFSFLLPNLFFRVLRWTPKGLVRKNTAIVKRAIERNRIDIWAHPNRYNKLDVVEVAKTCAERGTLIELSSKKISFRPIDFERMIEVGAKFIINSDAHSTKRVGNITRAEEFLKNCDYNEDDIINLKQTYTEYRAKKENGKIKKQNNNAGPNQNGNIEQDQNRPVKRGWFK